MVKWKLKVSDSFDIVFLHQNKIASGKPIFVFQYWLSIQAAAQQSVHWAGGYGAAFLSIFLASSFFLLLSRVHTRPPAGNANRWAARAHSY